MKDNVLIVAHGDLDGIVSAALLAEQLGISAEEVQVIFTQPFLVDKVEIPDGIESVYVVDIAVNNRNPEMTKRFIADLGDRLVMWYDHHQGWADYDIDRFSIHPDQPACAVWLARRSGSQRVLDAIAADTREGKLSETGTLIEQAIKSDMSNDQIRKWAVKLLMGAEEYLYPLKGAERAYALIMNETVRLATGYVTDPQNKTPFKTIPAKIAFVDSTDSNHKYDLTQLLLAGQKLADFAVVKTINPQTREEMVTVATKTKVNLVELFGLPSGATFRVSLPVNRLEEVVEKLHSLTSEERPCQCGSGEPWTICQANSPYCG